MSASFGVKPPLVQLRLALRLVWQGRPGHVLHGAANGSVVTITIDAQGPSGDSGGCDPPPSPQFLTPGSGSLGLYGLFSVPERAGGGRCRSLLLGGGIDPIQRPCRRLTAKGFRSLPVGVGLAEWRNEEDMVGWEGRQRPSELRLSLSLSLLLLLCNAGIRACGSESAALAGPAAQGM